MFSAKSIVIDAFVDYLQNAYRETYSKLEPDYPGIIAYIARMALENIARSEAPYHNMDHTLMVTLVGQEMLKGKHLREGGVTPRDWLNFVVSLLCHDIGYVRGICKDDREGRYVINQDGDTVELPRGATDASLTPYHINRGKMFVHERLGRNNIVDTQIILANIEYTRFPVPENDFYHDMTSFPGMLRAADLIGQMADPDYIRKLSALFCEFQETGQNTKLGYRTAADLREGYPRFYWSMVSPYIEDCLEYLRMTQQGRIWVANLFNHVFAEEHCLPSTSGPERGARGRQATAKTRARSKQAQSDGLGKAQSA